MIGLHFSLDNLEWGFSSNFVPLPGETVWLVVREKGVIDCPGYAITVSVQKRVWDFDGDCDSDREVYIYCNYNEHKNLGDILQKPMCEYESDSQWWPYDAKEVE